MFQKSFWFTTRTYLILSDRHLCYFVTVDGFIIPAQSPHNALRWGYSNAAVVPCVRPSVRPSVDLVNMIETTLLHVSLSNLADMLTMIRG